MVIILVLYIALLWLVFSKLKLMRFGWGSGSAAVAVGALILALFVSLLNSFAPTGRIVVGGRVVEVTPNVSGQVTSIGVKPNAPVSAGAVLFQIDPTPYQFKVNQLQAALAAARQQVAVLKANYLQATANVDGLAAQLAHYVKRLADTQTLTSEQISSLYREQDVQLQHDTAQFQLQAAKAAQLSAKTALDSEIGGVNTSVAQIQAQLDSAQWDLEQTTVKAPGDGFATTMALSVGDRAVAAKSVMSFILASEITLVGVFSQNGFQAIKPGSDVKLTLDSHPGRLYSATVVTIPQGIGQGQIGVSGTLARTNAIGGATTYPAVISVPREFEQRDLRLGISGTATVFAPNAGVIGLIALCLLWVDAYIAYL